MVTNIALNTDLINWTFMQMGVLSGNTVKENCTVCYHSVNTFNGNLLALLPILCSLDFGLIKSLVRPGWSNWSDDAIFARHRPQGHLIFSGLGLDLMHVGSPQPRFQDLSLGPYLVSCCGIWTWMWGEIDIDINIDTDIDINIELVYSTYKKEYKLTKIYFHYAVTPNMVRQGPSMWDQHLITL